MIKELFIVSLVVLASGQDFDHLFAAVEQSLPARGEKSFLLERMTTTTTTTTTTTAQTGEIGTTSSLVDCKFPLKLIVTMIAKGEVF